MDVLVVDQMESGKDLFHFWGKNIIHRKEVTYLSLLKSCLFILQNIGDFAVLGHLVHARAVCNVGDICCEDRHGSVRVGCLCGIVETHSLMNSFWPLRPVVWDREWFSKSISSMYTQGLWKLKSSLCIILFISQVSVEEVEPWKCDGMKGFIIELDPLSDMEGAGEVKVLWGESEG